MKTENRKERILVTVVFVIYLLLLCWLILFKLADSIDRIPHMRGINLIPFYFDRIAGSLFHIKDILYNVAVFIPAGFYFTALFGKKAVKAIALCAALSLCFEVLQWIFSLGASDITDFITNTLGGALGAGVYFVLGRLFKGREVKIVSIAGAVLEVIFIGLLAFLFISNQ